MKLNNRLSLLLTALGSLSSCLASDPYHLNDTKAGVISCAFNANCTSARSSYGDCLQSTNQSKDQIAFAACLCPYNGDGAKPKHADWVEQLEACVTCVENAAGLNSTVSGDLQILIGVQNSFGGMCKKTMSAEDMQSRTYELGVSNNFPLQLPDACLTDRSFSDDGVVEKRDVGFVTVTRTSTFYAMVSKTLSGVSTGPLKCITTSQSYTFSSPHTSTTQSAESVCNQDNCLRQYARESPSVASFCATYTKSVNTMTTGLPDVVSHCKNNPSRISSACSCLATITPSSGALSKTPTSTPQTLSSISHKTSSSVASSLISVVSTVSESQHLKSSSTVATSTIPKTSAVISATQLNSGIVPSSTSVGSYTSYSMVSPYSVFSTSISTWGISQKTSIPSSKQTTSTSFSSLPISQNTPIPSMKEKTSIATTLSLTSTTSAEGVATSLASSSNSSSTTSPSSVPTGWVTLPPSDAIKACAASTECFSAGSIWNACFSSPDGVEIHNCLCNFNREEWYKWVASCTQCVMAALPDKKSELGGMNATVPYFQDAYCNLTDPRMLYPSKVVEVGQLLAQYFESPIEFFNMTVVDQQIVEGQSDPPAILVSVTGANSATIIPPPYSSTVSGSMTTQAVSSSSAESSSISTTSQIQSPSSSLTSSSGMKLQTIASSSSSSSPSQTPTPESAFPISARMQACEFSKTTCDQSRMLFQQCIQSQDLSLNETAWDCLCTTNFAQWNSTTIACSSCIANALPPNIINAKWPTNQVLYYVNEVIEEYCNFDPSQRPGSVPTLILAGRALTSGFQSPILWWNITELEEPIAWGSL